VATDQLLLAGAGAHNRAIQAINWMMSLPEQHRERYWENVVRLEKEQKMEELTPRTGFPRRRHQTRRRCHIGAAAHPALRAAP
jgi:hypothetical protein